MKKLLLFLITFLIPFGVYAEETTDVTLKELVLKKTEGYTEVLSDAEIVDNRIVLNLKMYEVGDSAEYQFVVENKSSQDFLADTKNLVSDNPTITYELVGENKSNLVEKNSSKKFTLTITYQNEVERTSFRGGKYDVSSNKLIALRDPSLINPVTGSIFFSILLTILVLTIGMFVLKNTKAKNLLFLLLLLPISTLATFEYDILLESNIFIGYVTPNPCTYDGELVNNASYVNGQYSYTFNDTNDGWGVGLIDRNSTDPVTTTLCTSINGKPIISMSGMFASSKTTSIDTSSFDTSHVVNFSGMFYDCDNLISIDVSNFDLSHDTIGFSAIFGNCANLEAVNMSNLDFSTTYLNMLSFTGGNSCPKLKSIDLSNTIFPSSCASAFSGISSLEEIILDNVDTSRATSMTVMFLGCSGLTELNLSSFDTSNVTSMDLMFKDCSGLTELNLSSFDTANVTSMVQMFLGCSSLTNINLSSFDTSNVTNMTSMFYTCSSLKEIDLSNFDTSNVTNFGVMFSGCSNLKKLDMSNWDFRKAGSIAFGWTSVVPYYVEELIFENAKFSSLSAAFASLPSLKYVSLKNADTSQVVLMDRLVEHDSKLKKIDLTNIDTSNVTNMSWAFYGCSGLTELDVSSFNTSNVTTMQDMFCSCSSLIELDLSNFDFSSATSIDSMISGCTLLVTLDISGFDFVNNDTSSYNTSYTHIFSSNYALTTVYVGTQEDADIFNAWSSKPSSATAVVKI